MLECNRDVENMIQCDYCKTRNVIAGQAFTKYVCGHCFQTHTHANTAVPKICETCAEVQMRCQRCLNSLQSAICGCGKTINMCSCAQGFGRCERAIKTSEGIEFISVPMVKE